MPVAGFAGYTPSWWDAYGDVVYGTGGVITGVIVFVICWIYAVATFGFFIGIGLGWIPSLVIAGIAGVLWPLIAFVIVLVVVVVIYAVTSLCTSTFDEIDNTPSSGWRLSNLRGIMGSTHEISTRSVVSLWSTKRPLSRYGMSTAVSVESRIDHVNVSDDTITAHLVDGRVISVPLAWSWRLSEATPTQRANWELIGDGHGVHWPDIDEDLSADGMLNGVPAHRPARAKPQKSARANQALQPTSRARRKARSRRSSRAARG